MFAFPVLSKKLALQSLVVTEISLSVGALGGTVAWLWTQNGNYEPLVAILAGLAAFLAYFVHPALEDIARHAQLVRSLNLEVIKKQTILDSICDVASRNSIVMTRLDTITSEYLMGSGALWDHNVELCVPVGEWLICASTVNQAIAHPINKETRPVLARILTDAVTALTQLRSSLEKSHARLCHFPDAPPDSSSKLTAFNLPHETDVSPPAM
jgi:hypothetical protein